MTKVYIALFLFGIQVQVMAQTDNPVYNKQLADSLGADQYGMKMYVLEMLKKGTNQTDNKKIKDSLFVGHLQNIVRLANMGKLVVAGPLKKNENKYEGIFILNVKTPEEAKLLLDTDPAIKAKLLDIEIYQWYGAAALPQYLKFQDIISKKKF